MKQIMQTVVSKKEETQVIRAPYPSNLVDNGDHIKFEICGLTPERTIEDRNVYINIETNQNTKDRACRNGIHAAFWLQGEQAIQLGQALIESGSFALTANMIQHQLRYMQNRLNEFIRKDIIKHIAITILETKPVNYGLEFKSINICPVWQKDKAPKYEKDFNFDMVLHFTDSANLKKQLQKNIGNMEYIVVETKKETKE